MQETANNKPSSDHFYDDIINIKDDNMLPDCTSNEEHIVHNINKNNPTYSASKQTATPKPIMKSIHKQLFLRKRYV